MDFLFDNPLANLSGPVFLVIYGSLICFSALAFYLYKSKLDWTEKLPPPLIPLTPDPYEIAYLRGGENELARTLIFSLTQKGFLEITSDGKKSYINLVKNQPNWTTLTVIEREILKWFQVKRETSEVFESFGLVEKLKSHSLQYEQKINQNHFLTPNDVKVKTKMFSYLFAGAVLLVGFYRLIMSVYHGKFNVLFLLGFMAIASLVFWWLGKTKRLSELGKRYLKSLQDAFEKLKDNPKIAKEYYSTSMPALNAVDPLLLAMGVYGTGVLVGNGYTDFEMAFNKTQKDKEAASASSCSSGCGSSSGSSWSSCGSGGSSCSSGSSCGGGGGCGGGCGGS